MPKGVVGRKVAATVLLIGVAIVGAAGGTEALDRSNVPLKNWGGFSLYRDVVYDDLERLVTAGLADRAMLSTKPLSRTAAARLVGRAIDKIRADVIGEYNNRGDLEPVLDRLRHEFRTELAALGVTVPDGAAAPGVVSFTPIDRAEVSGTYASQKFRPVNTQARQFERGINGGLTFESRAQLGDIVTFYLQPELHGNQEYAAARLAAGYVKLTAFNVELLAGRDSLWWGPALHGSLILSNNAPPLDHIQIGAAEPFQLPFIGRWLGPTRLLFFVARLDENREHPRAKLAGIRASIAPFTFLELGISRTTMFGGRRGAQPDFVDFLRIMVDPPAGDDLARDPQLRSNNVFAIDADIRIPNVDRYFLPARDLRVYWEFGWDDTCCSSAFIPLREAISFLVGGHLISVFGQPGLEARFEYVKTSRLSFTHSTFTDGYHYRERVLSHVIGTDGEEWYARATNYLTPSVLLGVELNRAEIGNTVRGAGGARERRLGGGIDVSWRFENAYTLLAQYQVFDVKNRSFRPGDDGIDHLLRFQLTRSFR